MDDTDLYAILGVRPRANAAAIQRARDRQIAKYERMRQSRDARRQIQAEEAQLRVLEAANVLLDEHRRGEYDRARATRPPDAGARGGAAASPLPRLRPTMPLAVSVLLVAAGVEALVYFAHLLPGP